MQYDGQKVSIKCTKKNFVVLLFQLSTIYYTAGMTNSLGEIYLDSKRYRINAKNSQTSNIEHKNLCILRVHPIFFVANCNTKLHFYLQHIIRLKVNVVAKAFLKVRPQQRSKARKSASENTARSDVETAAIIHYDWQTG